MIEIKDLFDLEKTIAAELFAGKTYPWEVLADISGFIMKLGPTLDPALYEQRGEDIWVARDAVVFPSAYLSGPLIIDRGAEVRHCAFIRGSAIVGKGAVVGNSTELKNVVLFDGVQVPHYNYVGDSVLGYKAHFGAGVITSNVKARFVDSGSFSAHNVKVVTEANVVFLLGVVTRSEADAAAEVARTSKGVRKVVRVFEYISEEEARRLDNPVGARKQ